jgi:hypothetical protein
MRTPRQVFDRAALDFVLFCSSIQSFSKAAGTANYSAACTFKGMFAHRLGVKVINWGY